MSKLVLILSIVVASKLVFVASKTCTESSDCEEVGSCCYDGLCTTDRLQCLVKEKERNLFCCASGTCDCSSQQEDITCYSDWQCKNGGCCANSRCHPESSWRCQKSCTGNWECTSGCCKDNKCQATKAVCNTCYANWQCNSGCCKYNQCQDSSETCSRTYDYDTFHDTTVSWPETTRAPKCYYDSDCGGYDKCCVNGACQWCYQTTQGYIDDNDDYYTNEDDEEHENSSGGLGVGPSIGIAVAVIFAVILKLSLCGYHYSRRRQGVLVVRRRVTCVRVPIVENDQLQREHERAEGGNPARLPPAYSPRDNTPKGPPPLYTSLPTTSSNEASESAQGHGARDNTTHVHGAQQGEATVPPPAYQSNYVASRDQNGYTVQNGNTDQGANTAQNGNTNQNGNTAQNGDTNQSGNTAQNGNTNQTQAVAGMTGNAEQANGVPQGSLGTPPSTNPASP